MRIEVGEKVFPKQKLIHYPLVMELHKRGGKAEGKELIEPLADYFNLSSDLRSLTVNDKTKELKWYNHIRWARLQLLKKGVIKKRTPRGIWELTGNLSSVIELMDDEHKISGDVAIAPLSQAELDKKLEIQKEIGRIAEDIVVDYEKQYLKKNKKVDLANQVKRVSMDDCRKGYDILSFELDGGEKYIEVKGSMNNIYEFYISINELKKSNELGGKYYLYLVRGIDLETKKHKKMKILNDVKSLIENNFINLVPIKWRGTINED